MYAAWWGLADSILLFDEIQSLPLCHTYLFNTAVNFLASVLGCTVVLCTATQPELDRVKYPLHYAEPMDIVPDFALRFNQFRRTNIVPVCPDGGFTASALADFVLNKQNENRSILVILNTRAAVDKVFSSLKESSPPDTTLYCLTTHLCVQHRQDVIDTIKGRLADKTDTGRIICVSTQLIEAGVDLSFDCVVRSMAGLPSVAQAAGRCNRHGEAACRPVYLVETELKLENLDNLPDLREGRLATQRLLRKLPLNADLLAPDSIRAYYRLYFQEHAQTDRMGDPAVIDGVERDLFDLLIVNRHAVLAYTERTKNAAPSLLLPRQAFGTAEKNFHALEDITTPVLVPYGESGKKLVGSLLTAKYITAEQLRQAQPYAVGVTKQEYRRLEQYGALLPAAGGTVTVLQETNYDADKGVQTTPGPLSFLEI
ncbi:CRISPR-associated helicase/endonuclease Cas3 [Gemmiger sp.]